MNVELVFQYAKMLSNYWFHGYQQFHREWRHGRQTIIDLL